MMPENIVGTYEGGDGFQRTPKEELFLAAVTFLMRILFTSQPTKECSVFKSSQNTLI